MIEIQIHPSDIRRRVRYFFLGRRKVQVVLLLGVLLSGIVLSSMVAAPSVFRRAYKTNYLRMMRHEKAVQSERLKEHIEQMSSLERLLDDHRYRVEKLMTVYGLDIPATGQGGTASIPGVKSRNQDLVDAHRREFQLRRMIDQLQSQLQMLSDYESANRNLVRHIPSLLPVPAEQFVLTSPFGERVSPFTRQADFHKGLDLAAPIGTPIVAPADGVVTFAGRYPLSRSAAWWRFGNVVVINHADRFLTIYAHCDAINVRSGQTVRQGDVIATVGNSGWSTNPHLHYEIRTDIESPGDFRPVDPRIYILNYQWKNEERDLIRTRSRKEYADLDPVPSVFFGRGRS